MKTTTIRNLRHAFPDVLRRVEKGETLGITKRGRLVATISPATKPTQGATAWVDLDEHAQKLFQQPMMKVSMAQMLSEDRERY